MTNQHPHTQPSPDGEEGIRGAEPSSGLASGSGVTPIGNAAGARVGGNVKVGDEYFEARVDTEDGSVELVHWIVTSVQKGAVFATQKADFTWVKRPKTNGDYGWAKNISPWFKRRFQVSAGPPPDWARTKAAAYGKALPAVDAALKKLTKIRAQLTGQRTKARGKAARARRPSSPPPPRSLPEGQKT